MKTNINLDALNDLVNKEEEVKKEIHIKENELKDIQKMMKKLFPSGYWWTSDIDANWKHPKKYSIKEFADGRVTIKEVFKKAPWAGFTGLHYFKVDSFMELDIYKTEEEAKIATYNRKCPHCGGPMKYTTREWCDKCLIERRNIIKQFEKEHTFYAPSKNKVYHIGYTDELTFEKGFYGHHFVLKRLDTGEILETDNLWSDGIFEHNVHSLPEIEFIKE